MTLHAVFSHLDCLLERRGLLPSGSYSALQSSHLLLWTPDVHTVLRMMCRVDRSQGQSTNDLAQLKG